MKRCNFKKSGFWIVILVVWSMAGCAGQTRPSVFYDLNPDVADNVTKIELQASVTAVGIGPVRMPDALKRSQIVARSGPHRLGISEFHRWGGSLEETFSRVVSENLSEMLSPAPVAVLPWSGIPRPSHRVTLDVRRFDGKRGERLVLIVNWAVLGSRESEPLVLRRSRIEEEIASDAFTDYVAAQSRALAVLSRQIAEALAALP